MAQDQRICSQGFRSDFNIDALLCRLAPPFIVLFLVTIIGFIKLSKIIGNFL